LLLRTECNNENTAFVDETIVKLAVSLVIKISAKKWSNIFFISLSSYRSWQNKTVPAHITWTQPDQWPSIHE